jgi:hypothetical protein
VTAGVGADAAGDAAPVVDGVSDTVVEEAGGSIARTGGGLAAPPAPACPVAPSFPEASDPEPEPSALVVGALIVVSTTACGVESVASW